MMNALGRYSFSIAITIAVLLLFGGTAMVMAQTRPAAPARTPTGQSRPRTPATPSPTPAPAQPSPPGATAFDTEAKHALIVEADTGTVLFDKYGEERMPPASMSKIMTAYVVFSMLKDGKVKLTDELPVSEKAWKLGGSKMFVGVGGHISVENLIQGMLIQSGNDACVVLAEGLAGSEQAFVDLMNQKAPEIGLKDSHFANVTGLPDPNDWMTAQDLATLALRMIHDFPEYYHYFSEKDFNFNNIDQGNRNPLLYMNLGADGLKTGHTDESGYSLTGSVVRGDRRIILVVGGLPTMKARAAESERLVEWAFREFNNYKLFHAGEKVDDADVWLGDQPKVGMVVGDDLTVTLPRQSRRDMKVTVDYTGPIPAPITQGQQIGKVTITAPDVPPVERPLIAASAVGPIGTIGRMATLAGYLIWGNRH
jgi:serine-type D-Ala-D-Ala carboxypeptidase (penicillin-binding protein 5/6)